MDTKGGRRRRGGGGGVTNWEIGIDMYTLMCIKWMTNKNLLYKKINKIKFKNYITIIIKDIQKKKKKFSSWAKQNFVSFILNIFNF